MTAREIIAEVKAVYNYDFFIYRDEWFKCREFLVLLGYIVFDEELRMSIVDEGRVRLQKSSNPAPMIFIEEKNLNGAIKDYYDSCFKTPYNFLGSHITLTPVIQSDRRSYLHMVKIVLKLFEYL